MALTATIYNISLELADVDRAVYDTFELRVARHPSESGEYMVTRILAYALEYREGIALTEGVSSGDEPAVVVRDLTGHVTTWIEVGMPDAARLHRARKQCDDVAVYTHRDIRQMMAQYVGAKIHKAGDIRIVAFDRPCIGAVADGLERRATIAVSVTEREMFLDVNGRTSQSTLVEHRIPEP